MDPSRNPESRDALIRLPMSGHPIRRLLARPILRIAERVLSVDEINRIYRRLKPCGNVASLLQEALRVLEVLPRALLRRARRSLPVWMGRVIPSERLCRYDSDADVEDCLRFRTGLIAQEESDRAKGAPRAGRVKPAPVPHPIVVAVPRIQLAAEVARLPFGQRLAEAGPFAVYGARAAQIPRTLAEIGRLREAAFREGGEGTTSSSGLDRFDGHYAHLFVWHRDDQSVVGAYRVGRTDEILRCRGAEGLYTATLFRYRPEFFKRMGPALELGRSFVREEYRCSFQPLLLLWKGIGRYAVQAPRCRALFGAVSIRREYREASREIITRCLLGQVYRPEPAKLVDPGDADEVSRWISDVEGAVRGMPALRCRRAEPGGEPVGCSVDPGFQDALDCLLYVDLTKAPLRSLERYMGAREAAGFLASHGCSGEPGMCS